MWFWWFILICDCIIPAIMIIAGRMMWKHCPKKINGVVGYRTKMSMINMDTWRFAHDHAGKLWDLQCLYIFLFMEQVTIQWEF